DAVATLEETAKAGVDTPWCRRMGALACDELGLVAGANGRAEEAESWLRRAVDASGKTVPDLAKTRFVEYREARAVARLELGSLLLAQSRVDEAAPEIDAALEMAERIEAELPDVTTHPHLLARAKSAKAQLQAARGDRDGATTLAAEALALASRAVELAPDHAEYRAQRERLLTAR
ncbi:MAG TPA: tetratricopeptide repeat protein, partial [Planctomycetota bacterium]|nr:tetratricopeptide repeat protein [Planctomycetota bacterium]